MEQQKITKLTDFKWNFSHFGNVWFIKVCLQKMLNWTGTWTKNELISEADGVKKFGYWRDWGYCMINLKTMSCPCLYTQKQDAKQRGNVITLRWEEEEIYFCLTSAKCEVKG